jgi:4-aminobutyrate aminotransferase
VINEKDLAQLSHPEAPVIKTAIPGPIAAKDFEKSLAYESMARGAGKAPMVFAEGKGATVMDPDGNIFIDITAGVAVNSVGRCHPRVIEAMKEQMGTLMHGTDGSALKRTELAERISQIAPAGLRENCITHFGQSGSAAVETAIKFTRKITGRTQLAAFHGAYHGVWLGGNSLTTGDGYRKGYGPFIPGVVHLPYPYCYRCPFGMEHPSCNLQCAKYVDYVLNTPYTGADDVGALFIETIQGESGYVPTPPGYLEEVKKACEKHGALFIVDEIQTGAGRTGKMWHIENTNVEPDMLTFGKGIGGDMPAAGLVMRRDLAAQIADSSQPNTWGVNSVIAAAVLANIDILTENDSALIKRAGVLGADISKWLKDAAQDIETIGDVRGEGLMIGIEMVEDKESKTPLSKEKMGNITGGLLNNGVLMVPCGRYGNVFRFMPPLVLTRVQAEKVVEIFLDVIKKNQ